MTNLYQTYSASDFVTDDAFLKHQLTPDENSKEWWQSWLAQNPHKQEEWQKAVRLLEAVKLGLNEYTRTYLTPEAEAMLLQRINATNQAHDEETISRALPALNRSWAWYAAAACVICIAGLGWYQYTKKPLPPYQAYVKNLNDSKIEKINQSALPLLVQLPDGSQVKLFPQSRLSYDSHFGQQNRSVYLSGKAFFDVTKQPHSPFFVYANELVTKVLGTSFVVQAYPNDKHVEVQVKTGKVSVFTQNDPDKKQKLNNRELEGIVLTPNQQIILNRQELRLSKTLVAEPQILLEKLQIPTFEFEETPVVEVFELIEKAYGVNIVYDAELLSSCTITASLTDESLPHKIKLICQGIGASYETIDAQIVVYSKGCK